MSEETLKTIIKFCRQIDESASNIYAELGGTCADPELAHFWNQMSEEEKEHVEFWKNAEETDAFSGIPNPFEDPDDVLRELKTVAERAGGLLVQPKAEYGVAESFTLAFRMEFYLLHPAFEMLFHVLRPSAGGVNPEEAYESHINAFIEMLRQKGRVTPEMELLGETLQRLWHENKRLALQTTHDELTGVLNRRGFFTFALQIAHLAQRAGSRVAILMVDIDHFKSVNDRFGHQAGDHILRKTAQCLPPVLRASDLVGRYGGEEFIIMLPEIAPNCVLELGEKLREKVASTLASDVAVTVSIGVFEGRLGQNVHHDLLHFVQLADAALYRAKKSGRNRVTAYASDMLPMKRISEIPG